MERWSSEQPLAVVAAGALVATLLVWGVLERGWYSADAGGDIALYQTYGDRIVDGHAVPYRDFAIEYPPADLPVFALPSLAKSLGYRNVFRALMALCAASTVAAVFLAGGGRAAGWAALAPIALGSLAFSHFDYWPAALAVSSLAALQRERLVLSGALLGTAFAAKLWPILVAPFLLVSLLSARGRRAAGRWAAAVIAAALAWILPFALLAPEELAHTFRSQVTRPLQIESLAGSLLVAVHHVFPTRIHVVFSNGSANLAGSGVQAMTVLTSTLEAVALLALLVVLARGPAVPDRLHAVTAAAVTAVVVFGKVLSPQYLVWLVPFVPLARPRRTRAALVLAAALLLTQAYYPRHLQDYVDFHWQQTVIVVGRNLLLVLLLAVVARGCAYTAPTTTSTFRRWTRSYAWK